MRPAQRKSGQPGDEMEAGAQDEKSSPAQKLHVAVSLDETVKPSAWWEPETHHRCQMGADGETGEKRQGGPDVSHMELGVA